MAIDIVTEIDKKLEEKIIVFPIVDGNSAIVNQVYDEVKQK